MKNYVTGMQIMESVPKIRKLRVARPENYEEAKYEEAYND